MQNEFLPEKIPEYRTLAPITAQTEAVIETTAEWDAAQSMEKRTAALRQLKRQHQRRSRELAACVIGVGIVSLLLDLTLPLLLPHISAAVFYVASALLIVLVATPYLMGRKRVPLLTAERAQEIEGAESVGPLLDMLRMAEYPADKDALYASLTRCLSHIQPGLTVALTARQRGTLLNRLRSNADPHGTNPTRPDFCLAALKALEQIGAASDISTVEEIAAGDTDRPGGIQVREAAKECLPLLRIRAGLAAESKILLRASEPEKETGAALLRAASGPNAAKPEELLRPSDGGNSAHDVPL